MNISTPTMPVFVTENGLLTHDSATVRLSFATDGETEDCVLDVPRDEAAQLATEILDLCRETDPSPAEKPRKPVGGTIRQSADGRTVHLVDGNQRVWVPLETYMRVVRRLVT